MSDTPSVNLFGEGPTIGERLTEAMVREMLDRPPTPMFTNNEDLSRKATRKDVARLYRVLDRLGLEIVQRGQG